MADISQKIEDIATELNTSVSAIQILIGHGISLERLETSFDSNTVDQIFNILEEVLGEDGAEEAQYIADRIIDADAKRNKEAYKTTRLQAQIAAADTPLTPEDERSSNADIATSPTLGHEATDRLGPPGISWRERLERTVLSTPSLKEILGLAPPELQVQQQASLTPGDEVSDAVIAAALVSGHEAALRTSGVGLPTTSLRDTLELYRYRRNDPRVVERVSEYCNAAGINISGLEDRLRDFFAKPVSSYIEEVEPILDILRTQPDQHQHTGYFARQVNNVQRTKEPVVLRARTARETGRSPPSSQASRGADLTPDFWSRRKSGQVFRSMRQMRGWSRSELAKHAGITKANVQDLEEGQYNPRYCERALEGLAPSGEEATAFIRAGMPDVLSHLGEDGERWLSGQIALTLNTRSMRLAAGATPQEAEQGIWHILCFPALDPEWLAPQPIELQPALLLRAYRQRLGTTQNVLAKACAVTQSQIVQCERGTRSINPEILGPLGEALNLTPTEAALLLEAAARSYITATASAIFVDGTNPPHHAQVQGFEAARITVEARLSQLDEPERQALSERLCIISQGLHAVHWAREDTENIHIPRREPFNVASKANNSKDEKSR